MKNKIWFENTKKRNQKFLTLILLSFVLIFCTMFYNFHRTYQNARNTVIELSKQSSAQNAEGIELFFTRHSDILLATSEIIEYNLKNKYHNYNKLEELLKNMSRAYDENIYRKITGENFLGIYIAIDGILLHGFKTPKDLPAGYDPLKRQWYQEAVSGKGNVVFGNPYWDVYDPSLLLMTASKVLSDGKTAIGMDITMGDLQKSGGNLELSITLDGKIHKYGYGFIVTNQGIVMAHKDISEQGKCYNNPSDPMYGVFNKIKECVINNNNNNNYLEANIKGVNYGIFPYRLNNGWYVVTLTDFDEIRKTFADTSKVTFIGITFVTLMALIYCILISQSYIKAGKITEHLSDALKLAKTDSLTGVSNRTAYDLQVKALQEKINTQTDTSFALIMMDLNDLKYINDHFGHETGDRYILNCCNLFQAVFKSTIYRIGGDEFALFLEDDAFNCWKKSFEKLKQAVSDANLAIIPDVNKPSLAIGTAVHTAGHADDVSALIRKADTEMYSNKVAIKKVRLDHSEKGYTPDLKIKLLDKQKLTDEMQIGLKEEQFEVWFQPQINHDNHCELIGAEALVRWRHPEKGMISPSIFIPLFEYKGLIYELDKYVWKHTCILIRRWLDDGMPPVPFSVNVSRHDILQPDFTETIISIIKGQQIPYNLIHLEVTESAFSDDTGKVAQIVKDLIDLGIIIAIDDFGSGYSSLSLLRRVPAHIVKLDMSFFADNEDKTRNECIIESIIRMVKMLGMAVLAEGVETKTQANLLSSLGCAYIQGYLYSKPLPYAEYLDYAKNAFAKRASVEDTDLGDKAEGMASSPSQRLFRNIIAGTNDVIVIADIKTKELLYATPAAEQFFGKAFDPMQPTTCMDYCQRGDICKVCPATNLKPGEHKEFLSSENGRHIKSVYIQMDWNERNAFAFYQADISDQIREMKFSSALMNNLGVGILIFHGDTPDELIPVFCNNEYLKFSGLNYNEFTLLYTKNPLYGVHPDDIGKARSKFIEAFKKEYPLQCRVRIKNADGVYRWTAIHAATKFVETGSFEVYMTLWDAEVEMKKRIMLSKRYNNYIGKAIKKAADTSMTIFFNLTQNTCKIDHIDFTSVHSLIFTDGLDSFIDSAKENIANDAIKTAFIEQLSKSALQDSYDSGIFTVTMHIPIRMMDQRILWYYLAVYISLNPTSGDLEAMLTLTEADKDIRLQEFYQRIIRADYDLIGNINIETGFVTIICESSDRGLPKIDDVAVHYMDNLRMRMSSLVEASAVEASIEANSLNTILKHLASNEEYLCAFPAKVSLMGKHTIFRWRFYYADQSKSEILFSRKPLKRYLIS